MKYKIYIDDDYDDEVKTIKIQSTDFKYMKKVWNVAIKQFVSAKQNKQKNRYQLQYRNETKNRIV